MSAPPGWHPQDDGRERYWDGVRWTDQFRTPGSVTSQLPAAAPAAAHASAQRKGGFYKSWMGYVGAALVGLFVGIGVGGAGASESPSTAAASKPATTVTAKATVTTGPTPTATVTTTATVTAAPPGPEAAFGDGVWVVGEDIKSGTYKVIESVTEGCYWSITKSGTNGDDIISNDLPSGGKPKVTVKKGQDFTSEDCGDWEKVG